MCLHCLQESEEVEQLATVNLAECDHFDGKGNRRGIRATDVRAPYTIDDHFCEEHMQFFYSSCSQPGDSGRLDNCKEYLSAWR